MPYNPKQSINPPKAKADSLTLRATQLRRAARAVRARLMRDQPELCNTVVRDFRGQRLYLERVVGGAIGYQWTADKTAAGLYSAPVAIGHANNAGEGATAVDCAGYPILSAMPQAPATERQNHSIKARPYVPSVVPIT